MNHSNKKESMLPNLSPGECKTSEDCELFQIKIHPQGIDSKTGIL